MSQKLWDRYLQGEIQFDQLDEQQKQEFVQWGVQNRFLSPSKLSPAAKQVFGVPLEMPPTPAEPRGLIRTIPAPAPIVPPSTFQRMTTNVVDAGRRASDNLQQQPLQTWEPQRFEMNNREQLKPGETNLTAGYLRSALGRILPQRAPDMKNFIPEVVSNPMQGFQVQPAIQRAPQVDLPTVSLTQDRKHDPERSRLKTEAREREREIERIRNKHSLAELLEKGDAENITKAYGIDGMWAIRNKQEALKYHDSKQRGVLKGIIPDSGVTPGRESGASWYSQSGAPPVRQPRGENAETGRTAWEARRYREIEEGGPGLAGFVSGVMLNAPERWDPEFHERKKEEGPIRYGIGNVAGNIVGQVALIKLFSLFPPLKLAGPLVQRLASTIPAAGFADAVRAWSREEDPETMAKEAVRGMVFWGAGGVASHYSRFAGLKLLDNLAKANPKLSNHYAALLGSGTSATFSLVGGTFDAAVASVLYDEEERPSAREILQRALIMGLIGAAASYVSGAQWRDSKSWLKLSESGKAKNIEKGYTEIERGVWVKTNESGKAVSTIMDQTLNAKGELVPVASMTAKQIQQAAVRGEKAISLLGLKIDSPQDAQKVLRMLGYTFDVKNATYRNAANQLMTITGTSRAVSEGLPYPTAFEQASVRSWTFQKGFLETPESLKAGIARPVEGAITRDSRFFRSLLGESKGSHQTDSLRIENMKTDLGLKIQQMVTLGKLKHPTFSKFASYLLNDKNAAVQGTFVPNFTKQVGSNVDNVSTMMGKAGFKEEMPFFWVKRNAVGTIIETAPEYIVPKQGNVGAGMYRLFKLGTDKPFDWFPWMRSMWLMKNGYGLFDKAPNIMPGSAKHTIQIGDEAGKNKKVLLQKVFGNNPEIVREYNSMMNVKSHFIPKTTLDKVIASSEYKEAKNLFSDASNAHTIERAMELVLFAFNKYVPENIMNSIGTQDINSLINFRKELLNGFIKDGTLEGMTTPALVGFLESEEFDDSPFIASSIFDELQARGFDIKNPPEGVNPTTFWTELGKLRLSETVDDVKATDINEVGQTGKRVDPGTVQKPESEEEQATRLQEINEIIQNTQEALTQKLSPEELSEQTIQPGDLQPVEASQQTPPEALKPQSQPSKDATTPTVQGEAQATEIVPYAVWKNKPQVGERYNLKTGPATVESFNNSLVIFRTDKGEEIKIGRAAMPFVLNTEVSKPVIPSSQNLTPLGLSFVAPLDEGEKGEQNWYLDGQAIKDNRKSLKEIGGLPLTGNRMKFKKSDYPTVELLETAIINRLADDEMVADSPVAAVPKDSETVDAQDVGGKTIPVKDTVFSTLTLNEKTQVERAGQEAVDTFIKRNAKATGFSKYTGDELKDRKREVRQEAERNEVENIIRNRNVSPTQQQVTNEQNDAIEKENELRNKFRKEAKARGYHAQTVDDIAFLNYDAVATDYKKNRVSLTEINNIVTLAEEKGIAGADLLRHGLKSVGVDLSTGETGEQQEPTEVQPERVETLSDDILPDKKMDIITSETKEENTAFHAGDLGKAEGISSMSPGRGTGHFGTGTYFVGNPEKLLREGTSHSKRPLIKVSLDGYNLFAPLLPMDAMQLHDVLKDMNNNWFKLSEFKTRENGEDYALFKLEIDRIGGGFPRADEVVAVFEEVAKEMREELGEGDWHMKAYQLRAQGKILDSASTRVMKRLGYDGVDVRHITSMDDTEFGTVVYDLKPESILEQPQTSKAETKQPTAEAVSSDAETQPGTTPTVSAKAEQETSPFQKGDRVTFTSNDVVYTGTYQGESGVNDAKVHVDTEIDTPVPTKKIKYVPISALSTLEEGSEEGVVQEIGGVESQPETKDVPAQQIASYIASELETGETIKLGKVQEVANKAYGGTQAGGAFTSKDLYDAMELGVNQYLISQDKWDLTSRDPKVVKQNANEIAEMISKLPTQTKRTEEQEQFQQFSTPPPLAYIASWAANMTSDDVMLEPSAGIGGLAVFGKIAGANVVVNELSERRSNVLNLLNFDRSFVENAEQLNNILPKDIKPTVVVMNPPFSTAASRTGSKSDSRNVMKHLDQALRRLEPGGRLVAIVGRGMSMSAPTFKEWWKTTKENYNVRANIAMDGSLYRKYGTTFDNRILVIDKTGPTKNDVVTTEIKTLDELLSAIGGIANDRTRIETVKPIEQEADQPVSPQAPGKSKSGSEAHNVVPAKPDVMGNQQFTSEDSGIGEQSAPGEHQAGTGTMDLSDSGTTTIGAGEVSDGRTPSQPGSVGTDSPSGRPEGQNTPGISGDSIRNLDRTPDRSGDHRPNVKKELTDSVFDEYVPKKLKVPGAKPHPGVLAESAAMAAVDLPDINYMPDLPKHLIESGEISLAQLEPIAYAGQAHQDILPDGMRKGILIGDGTGVGKTRELLGIYMDNQRQGRDKAVFISKPDMITDLKEEWLELGGNSDMIITPKANEEIKAEKGILFLSYNKLSQNLSDSRTEVKAKNPDKPIWIDKIVNWVGEDFDGVLVFDESHLMAKGIDVRGGFGVQQASGTARAGIELQRRLPNARVVYASATAATEVENTAYMDRLGLWGRGTAFAGKEDFIGKINSGGLAAMEIVARDMKSAGVYLSRNLSYDDVAYRTIEHKLTNEQEGIYDEVAQAWQIVLQNIHAALEETGAQNNGHKRGAVASSFWGAQQRFFSQILTSMQMPSAIESMKKDIANGEAVVIQLVNTNEASQNRSLAKIKDEEGSLEDFDMTPRDTLLGFLDKSFPIYQYEEVVNEDGNKMWVQVYDSEGNPVINQEALARKEEMMARVSELRIPDGPLELIFNAFGTDLVAEVTGRSRRVVMGVDEYGQPKRVEEKRSDSIVQSDIKLFMDDKKRILIFSGKGGTGKSYHADLRSKNQRKRRHYLVQAGWEASKAMQGFGRTHRSNQALAPEYILVTTNVRGHKRFITSIARRLAQLGALTKGQRDTSSQGLFSEKDNLESTYAKDALLLTYRDLAKGRIAGPDGIALDKEDVLTRMGMNKSLLDQWGNLNEKSDDLRGTAKFLNRILVLEVELQNILFDHFANKIEQLVEHAIVEGTMEVGMETLKGDKVEVESEEVVNVSETGAETNYVKLNVFNKTQVFEFEDIDSKSSDFIGFHKNVKSGKVRAMFRTATKTDDTGSVRQRIRGVSPAKGNVQYLDERDIRSSKWDEAGAPEAKSLWNEEIKNLPNMQQTDVHLITGALLPIWDRLPSGKMRVVRVATEDGRVMLGRIVPEKNIAGTLDLLGLKNKQDSTDTADILRKMMESNYAVELVNGWQINRRRVSNEHRLELTGDNLYSHARNLLGEGVFTEKINYQVRYFVPSENDEVLKTITEYRPIAYMIAPDGAKVRVGEEGMGNTQMNEPGADVVFTEAVEKALYMTVRDAMPETERKPSLINKKMDAILAAIKLQTGRTDKPTIVANSITGKLINDGKVDFIGHKVLNMRDLAAAASVFRNPLFESARIVYMKDNVVVGYDTVSSRHANMIEFDVGTVMPRANDRMAGLKADGFYVLHNHPTGVPIASPGDINSTKIIQDAADFHRINFLGHVIINHDKYSELTVTKNKNAGKFATANTLYEVKTQLKDLPQDRPDPLRDHTTHPLLGIKADNILSIVRALKTMEVVGDPLNDNMISLFFMDAEQRVSGVMEVPINMFNDKAGMPGFIRNRAKEFGASYVVAGTQRIFHQASHYLQQGVLYDVIHYNGAQAVALSTSLLPPKKDRKWLLYGEESKLYSTLREGYRDVHWTYDEKTGNLVDTSTGEVYFNPDWKAQSYRRLHQGWLGSKAWAVEKNKAEARYFEQEAMKLVNEKKVGKKTKELLQAIHVYIDLLPHDPETVDLLSNSPDAKVLNSQFALEQYDKYKGKLSDEQKSIYEKSQSLTDKEHALAQAIIDSAKELSESALSHGVIRNVMENYIARHWKMPYKRIRKSVGAAKFKTTSRHAKERSLESVLHGWALGHELKYSGAHNAMRAMKDDVALAIEDKTLLKDLMHRVDPDTNHTLFSTNHINDYVELQHPSMKHWRIVDKVDLEEKEIVGKGFSIGDKVRIKGDKIIGYIRVDNNNGTVDIQYGPKSMNMVITVPLEMLRIVLPHGKDMFIDVDGNIWQRVPVYARADIGNKLNNILGSSAIAKAGEQMPVLGVDVVRTVDAVNALMKKIVLTSALFHPLAVMRSWIFFVNGMKRGVHNPISAYKEGYKLMENMDNLFQIGVRNGLTIGINQDWDEQLSKDAEKHFDDIMKKAGFVGEAALLPVRAMRKYWDWQNNIVFQRFIPGLKMMAFAAEYKKYLIDHPGIDPEHGAQVVAAFVNDDFGGINHAFAGTNKTAQHVRRIALLGPDWTYSNVNTVRKPLFKRYSRDDIEGGPEPQAFQDFYRKNWLKLFLKMFGTLVTLSLLLSTQDEISFLERYELAFRGSQGGFRGAAELKWLMVDISTLVNASDPHFDDRKYFNIMGHILDPFRWVSRSPLESVKVKGSIVIRMTDEAMTGTNWRGRRFTSVPELLGTDGQGRALTKFNVGGDKRAIGATQVPSFVLYQIYSHTPIFIQQGLNYWLGVTDGIDALIRGAGMQVTNISGRNIEQYHINKFKSNMQPIRREATRIIESAKQGVPLTQEEINHYTLFQQLEQINSRINNINRRRDMVRETPGLSDADRSFYLEQLTKSEQELLFVADSIMGRM